MLLQGLMGAAVQVPLAPIFLKGQAPQPDYICVMHPGHATAIAKRDLWCPLATPFPCQEGACGASWEMQSFQGTRRGEWEREALELQLLWDSGSRSE